MTTSDPTPPYAPPGNSPNGQSASDREGGRRRRSRRARTSSDASSSLESEADTSTVFARASELVNAVVGRIRRQPYASMAVAGGVGFVVGGALSFRAGRVVLAAAARHVSRELLTQIS